MAASTIRPVRLFGVLAIAGALLAGAHSSGASTGAAPAGCHGLSPASAVGCSAEVFAP